MSLCADCRLCDTYSSVVTGKVGRNNKYAKEITSWQNKGDSPL